MTKFRLYFFGAFKLARPDGAEIRITSKKSIALLAMLATAKGGRRMRPWLQDMLWGAREIAQAQASLRREISNLKGTLGAAQNLLTIEQERLTLNLAIVEVDIRGQINEDQAPGEFLEGIDIAGAEGFNDWLVTERVRLADVPRGANASTKKVNSGFVGHGATQRPIRPKLAITNFKGIGAGQPAALLFEELSNSFAAYSSFRLSVVDGVNSEDQDCHPQVTSLCEKLSSQYALIGTVTGDNKRISLSLRLYCASSDQIWQNTFKIVDAEGAGFGASIIDAAAQIDSAIDKNEHLLAISETNSQPTAWACYWKASAVFRKWNRDGMAAAIALAEQAVALAPNDAWAHSLAAYCRALEHFNGWSYDPNDTRSLALDHVKQALAFTDDDVLVLGYAAGAHLMLQHDREGANHLIARALALQPNRSSTLFWGGWIDLWNQEWNRAEQRFKKTLEINPRSWARPFTLAGLGFSLLARGDVVAAEPLFKEAALFLPDNSLNLVGLAVIAALTGRDDEAKSLMGQIEGRQGLASLQRLLPEASRLLFERLADNSKHDSNGPYKEPLFSNA